jgi:hypothetical protein
MDGRILLLLPVVLPSRVFFMPRNRTVGKVMNHHRAQVAAITSPCI